ATAPGPGTLSAASNTPPPRARRPPGSSSVGRRTTALAGERVIRELPAQGPTNRGSHLNWKSGGVGVMHVPTTAGGNPKPLSHTLSSHSTSAVVLDNVNWPLGGVDWPRSQQKEVGGGAHG